MVAADPEAMFLFLPPAQGHKRGACLHEGSGQGSLSFGAFLLNLLLFYRKLLDRPQLSCDACDGYLLISLDSGSVSLTSQ